jgi:hypothetical protein
MVGRFGGMIFGFWAAIIGSVKRSIEQIKTGSNLPEQVLFAKEIISR